MVPHAHPVKLRTLPRLDAPRAKTRVTSHIAIVRPTWYVLFNWPISTLCSKDAVFALLSSHTIGICASHVGGRTSRRCQGSGLERSVAMHPFVVIIKRKEISWAWYAAQPACTSMHQLPFLLWSNSFIGLASPELTVTRSRAVLSILHKSIHWRPLFITEKEEDCKAYAYTPLHTQKRREATKQKCFTTSDDTTCTVGVDETMQNV